MALKSNSIGKFHGEHRFLSNFHQSPIVYGTDLWMTAEHLYQSLKTDIEEEKQQIRRAPTPGKAKQLGRTVTMCANWDAIKDGMMLMCLRLKFDQNKALADELIATGRKILIEGNVWHDNYWGNCVCPKCRDKAGKNMLGKFLMQVRREEKYCRSL